MSEIKNSPTIEEISSILKSVIGNERATYISVPITTGQRFLKWYEETGKNLSKEDYGKVHFKEVIQPNLEDAQDFITHIRKSDECFVIEPTSLNISGWRQEDYHDFWETIIKLYVDKVYFLDGWYLSKGCSLEYLASCRKRIEIFDQKKKPLSIKLGTALIKKGIGKYERLGLDVKFQTKIFAELSKLM